MPHDIYQSTLKQKYFFQVNFSLAIMDIGANLVAFVRMDGCPVRRCSIPQRYTPKRKLITMHLTKDSIKKRRKEIYFPKGGLHGRCHEKGANSSTFWIWNWAAWKDESTRSPLIIMLCKCFSQVVFEKETKHFDEWTIIGLHQENHSMGWSTATGGW